MNLRRLSFSKAALVERCAYWMRPEVQWAADAPSAFASGGRVVHHAMACVANAAPAAPPEDTTMRALYAYARAWLQPRHVVGMRPEIAFAYDVATDTGRELADPPGQEGARWYSDPELRRLHGILETEICGRVDLNCMGIDDDGPFAAVWDYKFHFGPEGADARAQLELCALAVGRAYGVDRVKAVGVHVWADRDAEEEAHEFREFELLDVAVRLEQLAEAPHDAPTNEGGWCDDRYCPAKAVCPVATKAVQGIVDAVPAERLARGTLAKPITSAEECAWALVAIDLAEAVLAARKAEAKAFADANGPVPIDGKLYSGQSHTVEKPNLAAPGAYEVLQQLGLDFAIETSTSWAAMVEVGGKEAADLAREALREAGALKVSTQTVYMARAPKKTVAARAKKAS